MLNGVTQIVMTKMDVLDSFETIQVGELYQYDGIKSNELPFDIVEKEIKPVLTSFEGWNTSLENLTDYKDLPHKAKHYVDNIQNMLKTRISMVSTGPERDKLLPC